MNIQNLSDLLKKTGIRIPEFFWKEELVRYLTEQKTERLVEIPIIFNYMPKTKSKILDVGCRYSLLPIQLASLGHEMYGIDVLDYKRKHPNLKFYKGDIMHAPFKDNFFDLVISLSTLEHVGLGAYGDPVENNGDIKAVREIYRILRKDGKFLLTIPFGKPKNASWYRVYNRKSLKNLLGKFKIKSFKVYFNDKGKWMPCSIEFGENIDPKGEIYWSVAFIEASK